MIGTTLGPYRIVDKLGEGGMGQVYRARDTRLNRDVAIKVLPDVFATDADRLARFEREAQVLATLNHPNIAQIFGVEDSPSAGSGQPGMHALVMELVDGETLAERIALGPVPIDVAIPVARQIADALEAAHEQGIVHRDLKPANVKIKPDGTVKVLDFGLAKAADPSAPASPAVTMSPTMTSPARYVHGTELGVILGTAAYMSPEQAKGRIVDKRADIWAFGAVLFEMLSGRRAFAGDDVSDLLVAVLSKDVEWAALPAGTPVGITRLLKRCLERDPKVRLRDIGEARVLLSSRDLDEPPANRQAAPSGKRTAAALACVALALAAVAAAGWWRALRISPEVQRSTSRFTLPLTPDSSIQAGRGPLLSAAVSKDGRTIAWIGGDEPHARVFIRRLSDPAIVPLEGTDGAIKVFFSPDAESVAFLSGNQLKRIATAGGAAVRIADAPQQFSGAWADDNTIVLGGRTGLVRVAAAGGRLEVVAGLRPGEREYSNPQWLPGSRNILFTIEPDNVASFDDAKIAVVSPGGQPKILVEGGAVPTYVSSRHIVYVRGGSIMAVPFDPDRLEVTGKPRTVAAGGQFNHFSGEALYAVSPAGTLVYAPGGPVAVGNLSLVLLDRRGTMAPLAAPPRFYAEPAFSPDGRSLTLTLRAANDDTWIYDLERASMSRVTATNGDNQCAAWFPDGSRVVYWNDRTNATGLYSRATDGRDEQRLTSAAVLQTPGNFTPDGRTLTFVESRPGSGDDIYVLDMRDRQPRPFLATQFRESFPRFSPDGRWLAYVSDESGGPDVFVVPYPGPGRKVRISTGGGTQPSWRNDGREVVYRKATTLMSVELFPSGESLQASAPKPLVNLPEDTRGLYSMSPDGQRFVTMRGPQLKNTDELYVVLDWLDELRQLAPESKAK
jgi:serine/threonine-protein kinase